MARKGTTDGRSGPARFGGKRLSIGKLGEKAKEKLKEARALEAAGDHSKAAAELYEMSEIATKRKMFDVATFLATKSALCHAKANNEADYQKAITLAVDAATQDGNKQRSVSTFGNLAKNLQSTELTGQVDGLKSTVRAAFGVPLKIPTGEPVVLNRQMRRRLPKVCLVCGQKTANSTPDFQEGTAFCAGCGTPLV